jgi:hypothetical protein
MNFFLAGAVAVQKHVISCHAALQFVVAHVNTEAARGQPSCYPPRFVAQWHLWLPCCEGRTGLHCPHQQQATLAVYVDGRCIKHALRGDLRRHCLGCQGCYYCGCCTSQQVNSRESWVGGRNQMCIALVNGYSSDQDSLTNHLWATIRHCTSVTQGCD